jgi:hypothetical protein
MTFINEFTPPEDVEKYGLKQIDKRFEFLGATSARDWAIDRERDIYLRHVAGAGAGGRDIEVRNQQTFTFYWKGHELTLRLDALDGRWEAGEPGWSHWRLVMLNGSNGLPEPLKPHRREILADLKEALVAYQGAGAYSGNYTSYSVTLDIDSECEL